MERNLKRGYVYFGDDSSIPAVLLPPMTKGRPRFHDQSRNGVRVLVHRSVNGTTVDADCGCFGLPGRAHTNINCPLFWRRDTLAGAAGRG